MAFSRSACIRWKLVLLCELIVAMDSPVGEGAMAEHRRKILFCQ